MYLEGGTPPVEIKRFLEAKCVPEVSHIEMGTIWPRPKVFHLPATIENLNNLADLAETRIAFEIAVHIHIYIENKVIFQWYDAFSDDPIYLSKDIQEENVKNFCNFLSLKYKKIIKK